MLAERVYVRNLQWQGQRRLGEMSGDDSLSLGIANSDTNAEKVENSTQLCHRGLKLLMLGGITICF